MLNLIDISALKFLVLGQGTAKDGCREMEIGGLLTLRCTMVGLWGSGMKSCFQGFGRLQVDSRHHLQVRVMGFRGRVVSALEKGRIGQTCPQYHVYRHICSEPKVGSVE